MRLAVVIPWSTAVAIDDGCSPADTRQTPDSMGRGSAAAARFGRLAAAASASRWRSCTSTLHPMIAVSAVTVPLELYGGQTAMSNVQMCDSRHHNASAFCGTIQRLLQA